MILLYENVVLVALHDGVLVAGVLCQAAVTVAHAVALEVGFCHEVDSVLVAKVVPAWVIGVMAGAHSVEVELFEHCYVLCHALQAHHVAAIGVYLMAVGTLEEYGFAIDQNLVALVLHAAESHLLGD